jgi:YD repeat-containing protein
MACNYCSDISTVFIKQGSTFIKKMLYVDENGEPVNVDDADATITSQVRDLSGNLIADLTVDIPSQELYPGEYNLIGDTALWPTTSLICDVKIVVPSSGWGVAWGMNWGGSEPLTLILHTESFRVYVQKAVTA